MTHSVLGRSLEFGIVVELGPESVVSTPSLSHQAVAHSCTDLTMTYCLRLL